jgi:hypothetical protein
MDGWSVNAGNQGQAGCPSCVTLDERSTETHLVLWLQQCGHGVIHTFDLAQQNRTTDPFLLTLANQDQRVLISLDFLCSGEKDIHAFAESRRRRRRQRPTSPPAGLPAIAVPVAMAGRDIRSGQ